MPNRRRWRRRIVAALSLACLIVPLGQAAGPGTAKGALRLGGRAWPLTTAYAREVRTIPELDMGDPNPHVALILADRALPAVATRRDMVLIQLGAEGKAVGLLLEIDPGSGRIFAGDALLPRSGPQFFSQTPETAKLVDEGFRLTGGRASGRIRSIAPVGVMSPDGASLGSYTVDVGFDVAVAPAPELIATLTGEEARASDPARAIRRYFDAVAQGDLPAIRSMLAAEHPFAPMLKPEMLPGVKQEVFGPFADTGALMAALQKVYLYPAEAELFFKGPQGGMVMPMVREAGGWKVTVP